jgi:citrate lyase subunit beta/citryl-CoA lyase
MNFAAYPPRRSVLYMPGSNQRAIDKARGLPADCIIIDLEDAVAPEAKEIAREQALNALRIGGFGSREVAIRVNGLDTRWGEADLKAVAVSGATAVVLPKVENATTVATTIEILQAAGDAAEIAIWIMTETPRGVLELDRILNDAPRVRVIIMGTTDLASALRVSPLSARKGLQHALSHCVLSARAHGVDIIDGVHLALDDAEGFEAVCEQGRILGFDGKSLIHPRQIDAANKVFGVTDDEVQGAREIITAWQSARESGSSLAIVRGQLIEQMHIDDAQRVIALFDASQVQ